MVHSAVEQAPLAPIARQGRAFWISVVVAGGQGPALSKRSLRVEGADLAPLVHSADLPIDIAGDELAHGLEDGFVAQLAQDQVAVGGKGVALRLSEHGHFKSLREIV